jgi:WD40 repeat protein
MFRLKNNISVARLCIVTMLFGILYSSFICSMEPQKKSKKSLHKKHTPQHTDEYFFYNPETEEGVWINKELVKNSCKTIKVMAEDLQDEHKIPLNASFKTIKIACAILENKQDLNKLSLQQLTDVANLFNFLDVIPKLFNIIKNKIKTETDKDIKKNKPHTETKILHPDLQRNMMLNTAQAYLFEYVRKNPQQKIIIPGYTDDVHSVAFDKTGTQILVGGSRQVGLTPIELWNVAHVSDITHQKITGNISFFAPINSAQWSNNNKYIATGSVDAANNLVLWLFRKEMPLTNYLLKAHTTETLAVAFNHANNKLVSGSAGGENNLILWDIADVGKITHLVISGDPIAHHPNDVTTVAFGPDDTYIISGCAGAQNNLIMWNIQDLTHISSKELKGHPDSVNDVKITPDGNYIISCCSGKQNNLIIRNAKTRKLIKQMSIHNEGVNALAISHDGKKLASGDEKGIIMIWDISDPYNITTEKVLTGHMYEILSLDFSPDDNQLISSAMGPDNNFILWSFINEQEELIKQLPNYNLDQLNLVYEWCIRSSSHQPIYLKKNSEDEKIFLTLPLKMQNLLTELFLTQREKEKTKKAKWFGK